MSSVLFARARARKIADPRMLNLADIRRNSGVPEFLQRDFSTGLAIAPLAFALIDRAKKKKKKKKKK